MITILENPYKSVVVESDEGSITISEGDKIRFCLESGEVKRGTVKKLIGKDDKLKIQILPEDKQCEEIWPVIVMADGSLKLDDGEEDEE